MGYCAFADTAPLLADSRPDATNAGILAADLLQMQQTANTAQSWIVGWGLWDGRTADCLVASGMRDGRSGLGLIRRRIVPVSGRRQRCAIRRSFSVSPVAAPPLGTRISRRAGGRRKARTSSS